MADEPGLIGLADFVGYPVGQPENALVPGDPYGIYGLLDFTGIPFGIPAPVQGGRGTAVGGRRILPLVAMMQAERSLLDSMKANQSQRRLQQIWRGEMFKKRVKAIEERRQRRQIESAVYTIVLSEI